MPKFISQNDLNYINQINRELINDVIETSIIIFSPVPDMEVNKYGESVDKIYKPGIKLTCLIANEDQITDTDEYGPNINQSIECRMLRVDMEQLNYYPENGDVIKWNDGYYEINTVIDNQLLGGRPEISHSIICRAIMTNKSAINIRYE